MQIRDKLICFMIICLFLYFILVAFLPEPDPPPVDPKYKQATTDMKKLRAACLEYKKDIGFIPTEIKELFENQQKIENWQGPYISKEVKSNPWGNPYLIIFDEFPHYTSQKYTFILFSYGPEDSFSIDEHGNKVPSFFAHAICSLDEKPKNAVKYRIGRPTWKRK